MLDVYSLREEILYVNDLIERGKGDEYDDTDKLRELNKELKEATDLIPSATQVKEKYGSVRFYIMSGTNKQWAIIDFAEALSCVTCELCGSSGQIYSLGWCKSLCNKCADDYYEADLAQKFREGQLHNV